MEAHGYCQEILEQMVVGCWHRIGAWKRRQTSQRQASLSTPLALSPGSLPLLIPSRASQSLTAQPSHQPGCNRPLPAGLSLSCRSAATVSGSVPGVCAGRRRGLAGLRPPGGHAACPAPVAGSPTTAGGRRHLRIHAAPRGRPAPPSHPGCRPCAPQGRLPVRGTQRPGQQQSERSAGGPE